jgi:hypothetical protein
MIIPVNKWHYCQVKLLPITMTANQLSDLSICMLIYRLPDTIIGSSTVHDKAHAVICVQQFSTIIAYHNARIDKH